ncbi:MAG: SpoIIE family protein phosphatase [Calditrichaeota bacterium]|nr:SpoIIE family protein phosphatase [Calditrichota bacterium]
MGWLELFEEDVQNYLDKNYQHLRHMSVLVVDDEEHIVKGIEKFLNFEQYAVYTANNGNEALEIFKSQSPRIVITDLQMPGLNGLELLERIRAVDGEAEIIVLTGNADLQAVIKALKHKATDFLMKPVDFEILLNAVRKAESHLKLKDDVKSYTRDLEELFKEVHHSREYLETIIQNSPNATITYNNDGIITSWNSAAEEITGYTQAETLNKSLKEIFVFDGQLINGMATDKGQMNRQNFVGPILTKDQQMRYISRNANILLDPDNKKIGGIETFVDITEKAKSDRLLEKRYMQVQTINEIGKKVAASVTVDELIDFITSRLVKTFYESANILFFLYLPETENLSLRAAAGITIEKILKKHPLGSLFSLTGDVIGHVFNKGKSAKYKNAAQCELFENNFGQEVSSFFTFPILSHNKKYGVLHLENAEQMDLDDGDIFMMETIAEYVAISLDKIELLEKITKQNHLLEKQAIDLKDALSKVETQKEIIEEQNKTLIKDLRKAGDFQKSLLPDVLPEHPAYKFSVSFTPSNQLGGDYYDVFQINERYTGIVVTDASGHGVSSAMLSAMFKMTFGKYMESDLDPASVFSKINQDFCQVLQMGDFFTAFYGIVDVVENKFIYSNAGHPMPILYKYSNEEIVEFDSEGFLLGVMDSGITYERKSYNFLDKSRLFIFTDGLSETINEEKVQYGEERIKQIIKKNASKDPQKFLNSLLSDLKKYTKSDTFNDDLTLLVMDINL